MSYLLPRGVFVLLAWAMTCGLIKKLWSDADPIVFGIAGGFWVTGGMVYFFYLRKLRRDIEQLERNRGYGVNRPAS
jgi:hypothetical protein